jgi:hypothetical protein
MSFDPVSLYLVAASSDRARVRAATLREVAAGAPDRHWRRRPTRVPAWRRLRHS